MKPVGWKGSASFNEKGQFAWDQTSIKLALECPRKYFYKMVEGWRAHYPSVHLVFGGHYATALEHFHKFLADGMEREDALRSVIHELLEATWLRDSDGVGRPWNSMNNNKTRETLIRTVVWYVDEFREDSLQTYILSNGQPAVEHSFALPVDDDMILTGHIDRLAITSGDVYVTDNKTTKSTLAPYYFAQFDLDLQMSQYTYAGNIIYNIPIKGVIIDAAQIAVGFSAFSRYPTLRSDEQLAEWYDETMATIADARRNFRENHFPRNLTSCGNYGGCEFREVCRREAHIRPQFLKADFYQAPSWDPLEQR